MAPKATRCATLGFALRQPMLSHHLNVLRLGKPTDTAYIESLNLKYPGPSWTSPRLAS
jgi:hypothetical protein